MNEISMNESHLIHRSLGQGALHYWISGRHQDEIIYVINDVISNSCSVIVTHFTWDDIDSPQYLYMSVKGNVRLVFVKFERRTEIRPIKLYSRTFCSSISIQIQAMNTATHKVASVLRICILFCLLKIFNSSFVRNKSSRTFPLTYRYSLTLS